VIGGMGLSRARARAWFSDDGDAAAQRRAGGAGAFGKPANCSGDGLSVLGVRRDAASKQLEAATDWAARRLAVADFELVWVRSR
jgi:hypothetical protein